MSTKDRPAFITGSHAYGEVTELSDVDLVVRMDKPARDLLTKVFGMDGVNYAGTSTEIKIGSLHIIACTTDEQYDAWKLGTAICRDISPVTKADAAKVMARVNRDPMG